MTACRSCTRRRIGVVDKRKKAKLGERRTRNSSNSELRLEPCQDPGILYPSPISRCPPTPFVYVTPWITDEEG